MTHGISRRTLVAGIAAFAVSAGIAGAVVLVPGAAASSRNATAAHRPFWPHPGGQHDEQGEGMYRLGFMLARETATETGTSPAALLAELRAGKTLDQIAGAKAPAIRAAVLGRLQHRLDRAVSRGKLTSARELQLLARARTEAATIMAMNLSAFVPAHLGNGMHHDRGAAWARPRATTSA